MPTERADLLRPLRTQLRHRRRELPAAQRIDAAQRLARHLLDLEFAPSSGPVAGYWAMDGEIALHAWQLGLPAACTYCLPVLAGDRLLFAPWQPGGPLQPNRYGIPEPVVDPSALLEADAMRMVAMPLVGFDDHGQRLGMGGGWYDRTLASRHAHAAPPWLVGVGFELQRVELPPPALWDVPLDAVCTEAGVHDFRKVER